MRTLRVLLSVFLLAGSTESDTEAQRGTPDPERAAVQQVIVSLAAHIQSGNFTAIDSLFPARGVHILVDTATTHGWAEYRDKFLKPELAKYTNLKFTHSAVEAQVRGNIAWVAFRQQLASEPATTPAQPTGRATAVLEKRDGRWIIVHLHVSR